MEHQRELERLGRLNQAQTRLVLAVQELSLAHDLNAIMAVVRHTARELTGADGATFVLRAGDQCHYADEEAIAPLWKGQRFPMSACISGWTMLHRQPAVIEDIYADPRIPAEAYRPTFVKSLVMVPIRAEAPIGAIGNYWASRHLPATEEIELLQALANTTAVAMEKVQVYSELERRVHERTARLEAANRELEAYSYAVSHDLSAPVRSIRGLTELLAAESASTLSAESQLYLQKIQGAAGQMRRLIDDLLRLSKISLSEMTRQRINLSELAQEVLSRFSAETPQRQATFQVTPGLEAECDPGLMRIVLENLLSNAWKYTAKCAHPHIEFGAQGQPDKSPVFFVRDNGAGFDLQRAGQLFQPFRRLHSQLEFAGSGIGLATVQRIIQRHGGHIWAEAAVGQGATFYFTLGRSQACAGGGAHPRP
ncbi:MAG TPA: ATP-binding protein [Candidatus Sulfotelmatobacter sp.]|nr:ATP-binding protein [Candidatus Sulfotelmatobacter sp.]